jgi:hypothetical protein
MSISCAAGRVLRLVRQGDKDVFILCHHDTLGTKDCNTRKMMTFASHQAATSTRTHEWSD